MQSSDDTPMIDASVVDPGTDAATSSPVAAASTSAEAAAADVLAPVDGGVPDPAAAVSDAPAPADVTMKTKKAYVRADGLAVSSGRVWTADEELVLAQIRLADAHIAYTIGGPGVAANNWDQVIAMWEALGQAPATQKQFQDKWTSMQKAYRVSRTTNSQWHVAHVRKFETLIHVRVSLLV
jgi:hypothetical protein